MIPTTERLNGHLEWRLPHHFRIPSDMADHTRRRDAKMANCKYVYFLETHPEEFVWGWEGARGSNGPSYQSISIVLARAGLSSGTESFKITLCLWERMSVILSCFSDAFCISPLQGGTEFQRFLHLESCGFVLMRSCKQVFPAIFFLSQTHWSDLWHSLTVLFLNLYNPVMLPCFSVSFLRGGIGAWCKPVFQGLVVDGIMGHSPKTSMPCSPEPVSQLGSHGKGEVSLHIELRQLTNWPWDWKRILDYLGWSVVTAKGLRVEAAGVRVADEQPLSLKMEEGTPCQGTWGSLDTGKVKTFFFC